MKFMNKSINFFFCNICKDFYFWFFILLLSDMFVKNVFKNIKTSLVV